MKQFQFAKFALLWFIVSLFAPVGNRCLSQGLTWQPTNGPYGGRIFSIGSDRNGVLVAASENSGIFRSTDDGETWQQTSLTNETIVAFAVDSRGRLFAGSSWASGVYVSSDAGLTWVQANAGLESQGIECLAISPSDHIFAGAFYSKIYRSTNGGASWTRLQVPIYGDGVYPFRSVCVDSNGNVYAGIDGKGLYRSTDDGETWALVGFQGASVNSVSCPSSNLILTCVGYTTYRSTDAGVTWNQANGISQYVYSFEVSPSGRIFAFAFNGLFRSVNGGLNWDSLSVGLRSTRFLSGLVSAKGYVYAGSDGDGIARSTDNGVTWRETNTGITGLETWALASTTGGLMLAGTSRGLYVSANKGDTWTLSDVLPAFVQALVTTPGGVVFAAMSAGVYRSRDAGANWQRVGQVFFGNSIISVCADSSNIVYAGTSIGQIYQSSDLGESWTQIFDAKHRVWTIASSGRGEVFAGTNSYGIFRSTDRGITWAEANNGVTNSLNERTIYSIAVSGMGDTYAGLAFGGLLRSTDKGTSWTTVIDSAAYVWSIIEDGNGTIYAGSRTRVFSSSNHGLSWQVSTYGLSGNSVRALAFDNDGFLFAGMQYGRVFRSVQKVQIEPTNSYRLFQNYPNPFNGSTIIEFSLLRPGTVRLTVYNILGQEIVTVVSENLRPGKHEVRWNANVPSGIYFYRIATEEFVETKKMILLK